MSTHLSPAQIHSRLKHPVIDADGHWVEFTPVFSEKMRKAVGDKAAEGFLAAMHTTTEALRMTQQSRDERASRYRPSGTARPRTRSTARPR